MEQKFTEKEYLDSFTRAFRDGKADYIVFDGHVGRNRFLRESIQWGLDNDIIYEDKYEGLCQSSEQWTVQIFRLTELGQEKIFSRLDPQVKDKTSVLDTIVDM
jgi:hypothetical protein